MVSIAPSSPARVADAYIKLVMTAVISAALSCSLASRDTRAIA